MTLLELLILTYLVQLILIAGFIHPLFRTSQNVVTSNKGISVIVVAKDEINQLRKNIPFICEQDYPDFEVILMDDHSIDGTAKLIEDFHRTYPMLKYLKASNDIIDRPGKKHALNEAINQASNEIILLTDADCWSNSNQWLRNMSAHFTKNENVVLGVGQYEHRNGLLNKLIQYETQFTAMNYLGMAGAGFPYMGVGRNLAYSRSLYLNAERQHMDHPSGDDDIGIQTFLTKENVEIETSYDSQVVSKAPDTFREWVSQKRRHYSTAVKYPFQTSLMLFAIKASIYMPNYLLILSLVAGTINYSITGLYLLRWAIYSIYWLKCSRELSFGARFYLLPCFEIYFSVFDLWVTISSMRRKKEWG